jgi:hypothetical protein
LSVVDMSVATTKTDDPPASATAVFVGDSARASLSLAESSIHDVAVREQVAPALPSTTARRKTSRKRAAEEAFDEQEDSETSQMAMNRKKRKTFVQQAANPPSSKLAYRRWNKQLTTAAAKEGIPTRFAMKNAERAHQQYRGLLMAFCLDQLKQREGDRK